MDVVPPWVGRAVFVIAAVVSVLVVRWMDRGRDWARSRRRRLVLGIPWGTFVVMGVVLAVYLLLQGGLDNWHNPVVIPFLSWSYFYPLGTVVSGFAHQGGGHLIGNLVGTFVFGSLAEYAWGHFPRDRGATVGPTVATNPYARALLLYPAAAIGVALLTGVFSLGPTIGFSGVVFAFAGFALTRFPIVTALGLLISEVVGLAYRSIQNPEVTSKAQPRFIEPWWAGISIQGHLLGLLVGVVLGVLVVRSRSEQRSPLLVFSGVLLFVVGENLWALWWYRGNNEFVLFRAIGLWFVLVLSLLITLALVASDRPVPPWLSKRRVAVSGFLAAILAGLGWWAFAPAWASPSISTAAGTLPAVPTLVAVLAALLGIVALAVGHEPVVKGRSRREIAILAVLLPLVFSAVLAVPTNLVTVEDASSPGQETIEVRDYQVTYAENVTNEMVSAVNLSVLGETTQVSTSGVIVISEARHIWTTEISTSRLKFGGRREARVGGVGWRATVVAIRRGWSATGGPAAYKVFLRPGDERQFRLAYRSAPAVAAPRLANKRVAIVPTQDGFGIEVRRNDSAVGSAGIPDAGNAVNASGITFARDGKELIASINETRIQVASKETYN